MEDMPIKCNKCGKEMDEVDLNNGLMINGFFGYGSKYDTLGISMHICCDCFDNFVDSCMISPVMDEVE